MFKSTNSAIKFEYSVIETRSVQPSDCMHLQPLILSAEQQAELMSNPVFLSNQQQSMGFVHPQRQTVQYNKQQPNAPPYDYNHFMAG